MGLWRLLRGGQNGVTTPTARSPEPAQQAAGRMAKRGISLLDLAPPFPGAQALVPADLASHLENLSVISHRSTVSAGAIVHAGVVQPLADLGFPSLRNWPVEVP